LPRWDTFSISDTTWTNFPTLARFTVHSGDLCKMNFRIVDIPHCPIPTMC
jgi:hypothetical protein